MADWPLEGRLGITVTPDEAEGKAWVEIISGFFDEDYAAIDHTHDNSMVKQSVGSMDTVVIPDGFSLVVAGPYTVDGVLQVDGVMVTI
jgi:hypothetical protein